MTTSETRTSIRGTVVAGIEASDAGRWRVVFEIHEPCRAPKSCDNSAHEECEIAFRIESPPVASELEAYELALTSRDRAEQAFREMLGVNFIGDGWTMKASA